MKLKQIERLSAKADRSISVFQYQLLHFLVVTNLCSSPLFKIQ